MRKEYNTQTLADFINLVAERGATNRTGKDDDKYELRHSHNWAYANIDESDAWFDLRPNYKDFPGDTDNTQYQKALADWKQLEPARVETNAYLLESTTSVYRVVTLSKELFDLFDSVWTKKIPTWRRSTDPKYLERTGRLTLAGILKRLDKTAAADVQQKIAQAQNERAERLVKTVRNNQRHDISKALTALKNALESADKLQDVDTVRNFLSHNASSIERLYAACELEPTGE